MPFAQRACLFSVLIIVLSLSPAFGKRSAGWERLRPGLWLQIFEPQAVAGHERLYISVLKIDPRQFDFHLLTVSETEEENKTLPQWMEAHDLQAAINASMFWKDQQTSTGYMKNYDHVNNSYLHPKYEGFLVFNPKQDGLPEIQIIDQEHHPEWKKTLDQYSTVVQSFRMISQNGNNVWEQGSNRYSVASIGMTKTGYVLFIFCQTPVTIHDLNNVLLDLPLELKNCLFVEGGPTAGLVVDIQEEYTQGWKGTSESFLWSDAPSSFVRLPNVIGIRPQTEGTAETSP